MSQKGLSRRTPSRKQQHVEIALTKDVGFKTKTTALNEVDFVHNALPELNLTDIDTSVQFLGKTLRFPFMVSSMTGGYAEALSINRRLAEVSEELGIAMGIGSQRQALEDGHYHKTFRVAREVAPTIPIAGNIGATEVAAMKTSDEARRLVELVNADAFIVHLNPLQELLQPEGNTNFRGVLDGIARLVQDLSIPVIVKEIGAGISTDVARRLLNVGVKYIDAAGAGGTSWAGVETLRRKDRRVAAGFWDWGIPTADAIRGIASLRTHPAQFTLIASGGITSGKDIAKCIALGADLAASARPVLTALERHSTAGMRQLLTLWAEELRAVMFLTGSPTIQTLQHAQLAHCQP